MPLRLSPQLAEMLNEAVTKHSPHLSDLLAAVQDLRLTDSQRDELRQAVTDELCETGFRADDEPNARGLLLEDLIDQLGHL